MIINSPTYQTLTNTITDFVNEGRMFTAFEVSLVAKKRGVRYRHRHLRDTVHELVIDLGNAAGYTRTLRNVGAPEPAWVYHLREDDPLDYVPLPRRDAPSGSMSDIPLVVSVGASKPMQLRPRTTPPAWVPPGGHVTDQRGRLCIPVAHLAQIGANPGQIVNVACNPSSRKVYVTRPNRHDTHDPDTTYTVEPDGNVRLTQLTLERAGIDGMAYYKIDGSSFMVTVSGE